MSVRYTVHPANADGDLFYVRDENTQQPITPPGHKSFLFGTETDAQVAADILNGWTPMAPHERPMNASEKRTVERITAIFKALVPKGNVEQLFLRPIVSDAIQLIGQEIGDEESDVNICRATILELMRMNAARSALTAAPMVSSAELEPLLLACISRQTEF